MSRLLLNLAWFARRLGLSRSARPEEGISMTTTVDRETVDREALPQSPLPGTEGTTTEGTTTEGTTTAPEQALTLVSIQLRDTVEAELMPRLRGPLFLPGDTGYAAECAGYNQGVERRPAVVVGATGAADVMAAVAFATDHELPVGVLTTGHSAPVPAAGALLVSTRRMQGVRIDPYARTARVEAGVRWEKVAHEAASVGLAPLSGSSPTVGAVGYTLGGGIPLLGREFGYAADHVRGIDVVTAHGTLRQAHQGQYADLFWALRGGKGNFGVVTSMEIDLFPAATIYGGGLFFRGSTAAEVLSAYRRWAAKVPEEMTSSLALVRFPVSEEIPAELNGRFAVHVRVAYHGSTVAGEELVRPLRRIGLPLLDTVGEMPYTTAGTIHNDPTDIFPRYEDGTYLTGLDEDAADALIDVAGPDSTCPLRLVELRHLGGALGREPEMPNAVGNRDAGFLLYAAGVASAAETPTLQRYGRLLLDRMRPWSTGRVCLNFLGGGDASAQRVRTAFAPQQYRRLVAAKRSYDPDNIFRVDHNIPPTVGTVG